MSQAWIPASAGLNLLNTQLTNPNDLDNLLSEPTSPEIFLDWLRKGLGRASLHLEKHASTPYIDTIAYACTTSLVYNMQAESSRAFYLLPLMRKSGHFENLADAVLAAYESNTGTDQDMYQKSVLVSLLAAESYPGCKEALFSHISAPPEGSGDRFGSIYEVIDLDRPRAIDIFVNRAFGVDDGEEQLKRFHELVTDISLLDRDDQRSILPPADQLFPDHPQAWPIVTSVLKDLAEQQYTTTAKPISLPTYENVLYRIMNAPARSDFYALAIFARKMTPADAKLLAPTSSKRPIRRSYGDSSPRFPVYAARSASGRFCPISMFKTSVNVDSPSTHCRIFAIRRSASWL